MIVAITGTSDFLGGMLLDALLRERWCSRIIALDSHPPAHHAKVKYHAVDFSHIDHHELATVLKKEGCTTLIHAALPNRPLRNLEKSHEIQSVASMYLLHAAAQAKVPHLILASTVEVYGAKPINPNFLPEDAPRHSGRGNPFMRDKVDVEQQFERYARTHNDAIVTIMRNCAVLGPTARSWAVSFLRQQIIPTVLGYDPLIQFVHEHDVMRVYLALIQKPMAGAFNIVGDGVMPLSHAIAMAGKMRVPVPAPLLYISADMLWQSNISPVPSANLDFLKYACVADGRKAKKVLGFKPIYNTEETLIAFVDTLRAGE